MRFFFVIIISLSIVSCAEDANHSSQEKSNKLTFTGQGEEDDIITSNRLPFIGHVDVIDIEEDGIKKKDTLFETIAYFDFLNEDSVLVSNETYENKVWIAEFFFASCPTICPIMNVQMTRLHEWLVEKNTSPFSIAFILNRPQ